MDKRKLSIEKIITIAAVAVILAAWYTVTEMEIVDTALLPKPYAVWEAFI